MPQTNETGGTLHIEMKMKSASRQSKWKFRLVRFLFATALFITSIPTPWVLAQAANDGWDVPLNLSHSGVAVNPTILVDSAGVVHAVWQDDTAEFLYTRLEDDQWRAPEITGLNNLFDMPFGREAQWGIHSGPNPLFIAGPGQYIFAFWVTTQRRLYASRVVNTSFEQRSAWEPARLITPEAGTFSVTVDARGEWHLAYLRTVEDSENPAGVYYTHSENLGRIWVKPMRLYDSPYFRRLVAGEGNLSLATAESGDALHVYLAWDIRPRKQVFLAQSADGGQTWPEPALIAGPTPNSGSADPFNIHVGANEHSVMLIWQSGRLANGLLPACSQIYQSSKDAGATWSDPQLMSEDLFGCPQSNEFVTGLASDPDGPLYLMTESKGEVFLTAWNGTQWSQPQAQPLLAGFEEPEIYTEVIYGCHRGSFLGERLYIIGCDQGDGGDVWVTSRDLGTDSSWFKPPVWSHPSPVTTTDLEVEAMELVATDDGIMHAFVTKHQDSDIYYTYWNGNLWSRITPVLELPEGEARRPAIAAGPGDELFLIAPSNRGGLYFSRAASGNAGSESRWLPPTPLETVHTGQIGSVDVARDAAGTVYVTYSIPVNDERGIYLVQSKDHGESWSEPVEVFNGANAGFDLVGAPTLLISENGFLHIVWKQQSVQGDGVAQSLALFYARSEDNGLSFVDPTAIVEESVGWHEIMTDGKGNLHLLWQPQDTFTTVWDQLSQDGGQTWQYPQGLPDEARLVSVTKDAAGGLHLVSVGQDALSHWLWDGSHWQSEVPLGWPLALQQQSPVDLLAAALNNQGKMMVLISEPSEDGDVAERTLLFSTHTLDLPSKQPASETVPTQTVLPSTLAPTTPTPGSLLTPTASVDNGSATQEQTDRVEPNEASNPFVIALIPVALLLLTVLGLMVRRAARIKSQ